MKKQNALNTLSEASIREIFKLMNMLELYKAVRTMMGTDSSNDVVNCLHDELIARNARPTFKKRNFKKLQNKVGQ